MVKLNIGVQQEPEYKRIIRLMQRANVDGAEHERKIIDSIPEYIASKDKYDEPEFTAKGWIGVDFDGTLATWLKKWGGWQDLGKPVPKMIERVKKWIKMGLTVKVFTARVGKASLEHNHVSYSQQAKVIQDWCEKYIGHRLEVTAEKDMFMIGFLDDACVQVKQSTGEASDEGYSMLDGRIAGYLKLVKQHKYDYLKEIKK